MTKIARGFWTERLVLDKLLTRANTQKKVLPWNHNKLSGERTSLSWFLFLFINQKDYDTYIVRSLPLASLKWLCVISLICWWNIKDLGLIAITCAYICIIMNLFFNNNTKSRCYQAWGLVVSSKYTVIKTGISLWLASGHTNEWCWSFKIEVIIHVL